MKTIIRFAVLVASVLLSLVALPDTQPEKLDTVPAFLYNEIC